MVDQPYNITFFVFKNLFIFLNEFHCIFLFVAKLLIFSCISVFLFLFPLVIDSSGSCLISGLFFFIFWTASYPSKVKYKYSTDLATVVNIYSSSHTVIAKKIKVVALHLKCGLFSFLANTLYKIF